MSKRSRRIERRTKRKSWRMTCQEAQENFVQATAPSTNSEHKCIFCGSTHNLQRHHCWQKRFNGPDTADNLVWICPACHRTFHIISDINLSHIVRHKNIDNHEIREIPKLVSPEPQQSTPITPIKTENPSPVINIYGGQVTFNF